MDITEEIKLKDLVYAEDLTKSAINEFKKNNYSMSENLLTEALSILQENKETNFQNGAYSPSL